MRGGSVSQGGKKREHRQKGYSTNHELNTKRKKKGGGEKRRKKQKNGKEKVKNESKKKCGLPVLFKQSVKGKEEGTIGMSVLSNRD